MVDHLEIIGQRGPEPLDIAMVHGVYDIEDQGRKDPSLVRRPEAAPEFVVGGLTVVDIEGNDGAETPFAVDFMNGEHLAVELAARGRAGPVRVRSSASRSPNVLRIARSSRTFVE